MVRPTDYHTDFFDVVIGGFHIDILAVYLFIICQYYLLRTSVDQTNENSFSLKKTRNRYLAKAITDADYVDDLMLLSNTPAQAKSLGDSLEQVASGIGLFMIAVSLIRWNHFHFKRHVSKLVNQFIYLDSNISFTERDINIGIGKARTTIDKSIIWTFDFSDKIKWNSF